MSLTTSSVKPNLKNEIVRAGAGAGKTTGLIQKITNVYQAFASHGLKPRIVVTTFTRKATQEVKERLLIQAFRSEDPEFLQFVSSPGQLFVSTIHGVLLQFLSRYGFHAGLNPDFALQNAAQLQARDFQLLRSLLKKTGTQSLLEEYKAAELLQAARHFSEMKILGKYSNFLTAEQWAEAYQARFTRLHAICGKLCRDLAVIGDSKYEDIHGVLEKLKGCQSIDHFESLQSLRSYLIKPRKSAKSPLSDSFHELFAELQESIDEILENPPSLLAKMLEVQQATSLLFEEFAAKKQAMVLETGELDVSDLESLSFKLAQDWPEMAQAFSQEWDFWLIDEYQDTSPVQVELLKKLVGDRPHFVVGDPQQSIYLFRGARNEVFEQKEQELESNGGEKRILPKNYRSTPELLEFINDTFAPLAPRFQAMEPRHGDYDPSKMVAEIHWLADNEQECVRLTQHIIELLKSGARPDQICVLGRTNQQLSSVARHLQKAKLPYFVHWAGGFAERREVTDLLNLIQFAFVPQDDETILKLLRAPWFRIDDSELAQWRQAQSKEQDFWTYLITQCSSNNAVQALREFRVSCKDKGVRTAVIELLHAQQFFSTSFQIDPSGRREANIWKVLDMLSKLEGEPGANFLSAIERICGGGVKGEEGGGDAVSALEPDRINLMTVHASKGLQFEHVCIVFAGEAPRLSNTPQFFIDEEFGVASLAVQNDDDMRVQPLWVKDRFKKFREKELLENERLLYVAMTRAKESLYISSQKKAHKQSWAHYLPREEGIYQKPCYVYKVSAADSETEAVAVSAPETQAVTVRAPWTNQLHKTAPAAIGVTTMLESMDFSEKKKPPQQILARLKLAEHGVIFHRIFESLRYQGAEGVRALIEKSYADQSEKIGAALDFIFNLQAPPMVSLLQNGFAEWGFTVKKNDRWLQGQIDLWGRSDDGGIWIVDYKTGRIDKDKAFAQLAVYAEALRLAGLAAATDAIHLCVLYPFSGDVFVQTLEGESSPLQQLDLSL